VDHQSRGLALDATHVYFAHSTAGTIERLAKDTVPGTTPESIADAQSYPLGIAVDERFVYWANNGAGRVMRLAK
jgi:sugar lactone lactonase YvrE